MIFGLRLSFVKMLDTPNTYGHFAQMIWTENIKKMQINRKFNLCADCLGRLIKNVMVACVMRWFICFVGDAIHINMEVSPTP